MNTTTLDLTSHLPSISLAFDRVLLDQEPTIDTGGGGGGGGPPPAGAPAAAATAPAAPPPAAKADATGAGKSEPKGAAKAAEKPVTDPAKPAEAKPAEPPKETSKRPTPEERESAALARALEIERKVTAARGELKREKESLETERATLSKALEAERAKVAGEIAEAREIKRLVKDDIAEFFRRSGTSYEEVTKALATKRNVPPEVREALEKAKALEEKLNAKDKAEAERAAKAEAEARAAKEKSDQEAQERAVDAELAGFGQRLRAVPDGKYAGAALFIEKSGRGALATIREVGTQIHKETGRAPTEEAVAERLESMIAKDFEPWLDVPSVRAMVLAKVTASTPAQPATGGQSQPGQAKTGAGGDRADGPATLSNDLETDPGARGTRPLVESDDEKLERISARIENARKQARIG